MNESLEELLLKQDDVILKSIGTVLSRINIELDKIEKGGKENG